MPRARRVPHTLAAVGRGNAVPALLLTLLVAALVVALAGCSGGSARRTSGVAPAAATLPSGPASTGSSGASAAPPAAAPSASAVPAGARAGVDLALALGSPAGDPAVVVAVRATGYAPRGVLAGARTPGAAVTDVRVDYGDGVQADAGGLAAPAAAGTPLCQAKAPLGVLAVDGTLRHTYARPGRYTVTVDVATCEPGRADARSTSRDLVVTVARPAAGAGGVTLALRRTSPDGAREVAVDVTGSGTAPRGLDATGTRTAGAAVLGVAVDFGDGGEDDAPPAARCDPGAPSGTLAWKDVRRHTYARAGTFTVSYTLLTCAPDGATTPTTKTLAVTVR